MSHPPEMNGNSMSEESLKSDTVPADEVPQEEHATRKTASAENLRILEALIFASDEYLTAARLKAILPGNPGAREISSMIEKINRQLQKERHPFEIVEIGGGYQFKTVAYYHPWVRQIFQEKAAKRLSIQALECLSIIAYRQPLSKAEIEAIRGVISDGAMKTLLEKRLITITGRSEKPGRPLLYGTTPDFLKYFGLNRIADLPNIEEFEALVRQKIENLPIEELASAQSLARAQSAPVEELVIDESGSAELVGRVEGSIASREEEMSPHDGAAPAEQPATGIVTGEAEDGWAWLNEKSDLITTGAPAGEAASLDGEPEAVAPAADIEEMLSPDTQPEGEPFEQPEDTSEPAEFEEVTPGNETGIVVSDAASEEIEIEKPAENNSD
jgi:segregation and condensation protein B